MNLKMPCLSINNMRTLRLQGSMRELRFGEFSPKGPKGRGYIRLRLAKIPAVSVSPSAER